MIVNLDKFLADERPSWERLDQILQRNARDPWREMTLEEVRELERLYQRASADLARVSTFSAEPEMRRYLESLVARGYAEVYGARAETKRFRPWTWFTVVLPNTFRRHFRAFAFSALLMVVGAVFGALALRFDPEAKEVLMPFPHLLGDPNERVALEEAKVDDGGGKAAFSGMLMTHNTQVALTAMALGLTWGIGTLIIMFYNGVALGAVALDYVLAGQTEFLLGWLLPHGVIELPAVLVGGQAGFVLAIGLLGRGSRLTMAARFREVSKDVVTLAFGAALMLVWAGFVEAFLSQYHEPVIPYSAKITFGVVEAAALTFYLIRSGKGKIAGSGTR